jgi:ATP phosphoribosyltransferase
VTVSIAVCTGVLLEGSLELLAEAGITRIDRGQLGRRLLLDKDGVRVVLVRPADVAAYVDFGAVDLGVVGKDQLWENPGSHYELVDLGFGGCTLVMAVPESSELGAPQTWPPVLRVATKYPRATAAFFAASGRAADIVGLHGSVELAPQVGLVDGIVDLTASGRTLRENKLRVAAVLGSSTARLIANQASLKTRTDAVQSMVARLRAAADRPAPSRAAS